MVVLVCWAVDLIYLGPKLGPDIQPTLIIGPYTL